MNTKTRNGRNGMRCRCDLCQKRDTGEAFCGSCHAGILVGINHNEIQRCDECALFESDDDAVAAVRVLTKLLHKTYKRQLKKHGNSFTVADAMDLIVAREALS